jgi:hypothetical protein
MTNARQLRLIVEWNATEKKERLLDFAMVHQGVFFRSTKAAPKSDGGSSSNAKRKS